MSRESIEKRRSFLKNIGIGALAVPFLAVVAKVEAASADPHKAYGCNGTCSGLCENTCKTCCQGKCNGGSH